MTKKRFHRKGEIPPYTMRYTDNHVGDGELDSKQKLVNGITDLDNGVMMTTSEIIDFSEGTDSWS